MCIDDNCNINGLIYDQVIPLINAIGRN